MADKLHQFLLNPLTEFYGRFPFGKGFAERLQPYAENLTEEMLHHVAREMQEVHKTFPKLDVLIRALQGAERRFAPPPPGSSDLKPWDTDKIWEAEKEAKRKALAILRGEGRPLAEEADDEGWLPALYDFVVERQRLPDARERRHCQESVDRMERHLESFRGHPLERGVIEIAANMRARRRSDVFGVPFDPKGLIEALTKATVDSGRAGTGYRTRIEAEAKLEDIRRDPPQLLVSQPGTLKLIQDIKDGKPPRHSR